MNQNQHILVTGGAGYIGSILVPILLAKNYRVTVVDNLIYRQTSLIDCFSYPKFHFIQGDVNHTELMIPLIEKADIIIPLAAIVGAPACKKSPLLTQMTNFDAIKLIMNTLSKEQKVIFPTTNSGYGVGKEGVYCTENSPLKPVSLYGKLKVQIEDELLNQNQATSFRLATVFGASPRMRTDLLVNDFTYRALYDRFVVLFEEHFKRNYIHVKDVALAFVFGIKNFDTMKGQAYNVGLTSANLSKHELCEKIKSFLPDFYIHSAPIGEDPDRRNYIVSNEKLESLGWQPQYSLDDGIKELIGAYKILKLSQFSNV